MDRDGVALRIRRLVIASALLELEISLVAEFLGEPDVGAQNQGKQIRAIRVRTRSRPDKSEFREWATRVDDLLRERGLLVHGGFLGEWRGNEMVPQYWSHKKARPFRSSSIVWMVLWL
jgi:hypothetical protein